MLNVKTQDSRRTFGPEQGVSPKLLSADERFPRWRDIWFPDARFTVERSS
jgi:hypothetical protein